MHTVRNTEILSFPYPGLKGISIGVPGIRRKIQLIHFVPAVLIYGGEKNVALQYGMHAGYIDFIGKW